MVKSEDVSTFWNEKGVGDYYDRWKTNKIFNDDYVYINHADLGLKNGLGEYGFRKCTLLSYNLYIETDYEYMGEFIPQKKLRKLKLQKINII